MIYKAQGKVSDLTPIEQVEARSGQTYRKQYVVLEVEDGNRTETIAIRAFGNAVDETEGLRPGEDVSVTFAISSREYNGRWYTDLELIHVRVQGMQVNVPHPASAGPDDDLPDIF